MRDVDQQLFDAVERNKEDEVARLLRQGADVKVVDENCGPDNGRTPLFTASRYGYDKIARMLIDKGAHVKAVNHNGSTPLHVASGGGRGFDEIAKMLIDAGADVNAARDEGWTPLHDASYNGHAEIARILIDAGADANAVDKWGLTPLNRAKSNNKPEVVKLLEDVQASRIVPADQSRKKDKAEAKNDTLPSPSPSPKLHDIDRQLFDAVKGKEKEKLALLLQHGANAKAVDIDGSTPLHYASKDGYDKIAKLLIDAGADVNAVTYCEWPQHSGYTSLHYASKGGSDNIARMLIDAGADVNAVTYYKWTPLHWASSYGYGKIARMLIEEGAKVKAVDKNGKTPLDRAKSYERQAVVKILEDVQAGRIVLAKHVAEEKAAAAVSKMRDIDSQLFDAVGHNEEDEVSRLLREGADVKAVNKYGYTPLQEASSKGYVIIARILIDEGADVKAVISNGGTPLHVASGMGFDEIATMLIGAGADVNAARDDGWTPLHHGSYNGYNKIARILIDAGADVKRVNAFGSTPLHYASSNGYEKIARMLIDEGSDVNAVDTYGKTPLDEAKSNKKQAVVKLLEDVQAGRIVPTGKHIAKEKAEAPDKAKVAVDAEANRKPELDTESQVNSIRIADVSDHPIGNQENLDKGKVRHLVELTEEDIKFIRRGREMASGSQASPITFEERSALTVLSSNLVDIERSLESVRGLPKSLLHKPFEAEAYYVMFTSAFERSYVAALAISSGAANVSVDLKDTALVVLLGAAGWAAEKSNVPFVGIISIFSTLVKYQRETRKKNLFWAFQDFFGGGCQNGRDHYMLTYRRLAEAICLRMDYSRYSASSNIEDTAKHRLKVKEQSIGIIDSVRKHLRKVHLDALENLQPIEAKAMVDLSIITEEVMRLYQEDQDQYDAQKIKSEDEKTEYLLQKVWNFEYSRDKPHVPNIKNQKAKSLSTCNKSTDLVNISEIQSLQEELAKLKADNMELKKAASTNAKLQRQVQSQEKRIQKIQQQFDCDNDQAVGRGSQVQLQKSGNATQRSRGENDLDGLRTLMTDIRGEVDEIRRQQVEEVDTIRNMKLDSLVRDRMLSLSEAHSLIEEILYDSCSGVISPTGVFTINRKAYQIGVAPKGRFSLKKQLWRGRVQIKIEDEYKGTKSVMYWFDKNNLRFLYESKKHAAIYKIFARELCVNNKLETNECRYMSKANDREDLLGGL